MHVLSGIYSLDGQDLWDVFSIGVESGTDGFIQFPELKDRLTEDWQDENGIDVDVDTPSYVKSRDITINFFSITKTEDEFWQKWDAFKELLISSGLHLFYVKRFKRSFGVLYKSSPSIDVTNKTFLQGGKVKFSITLTELNPALTTKYFKMIDSQQNHIVDDQNNFFQIVETN